MWRTGGDNNDLNDGVATGCGLCDVTPLDGWTVWAELPSPAVQDAANEQRLIWLDVARQLGLSQRALHRLSADASRTGSSLPAEILASLEVGEDDFYRALGRALGVAVCLTLEPQRLHLNARQAAMLLGRVGDNCPIRYTGDSGATIYLLSPDPRRLGNLIDQFAALPGMRQRIVLAPRSVMRAALADIARPALMARARDRLFLTAPLLSARTLANGWQGVLLGALMICLPVGLALQQQITIVAIHMVATLFFMGGIALRLLAIPTRPHKHDPAGSRRQPLLPLYTILIALRNEAEVVPELLVSLGKLSWPRSRLEVKFVCEVGDRTTIDAVRAGGLRPWVEVIEVPKGMVKTKPNALSYALPQTSGDFVVLYDAEDRPAPDQLNQAWRRFQNSDRQLACLQAPLQIDNGRIGILPRMFALEYASLFHRILPMLGKHGLVMPLGGTSNHFRREALDHVGAWDPYNVTEDADLGIRLARFGYRCDVLHQPTGEDAPDAFSVWLRQRSRWMKGWMHTLLVHTRQPVQLASSLGFGSAVMLILLMGGMVVSALLHPLLLGSGIWFAAQYVSGVELSRLGEVLFALDAVNILLGYAAFLILGWVATGPTKARRRFWKVIAFTPVYWMMLSVAAWRGLFQLVTEPHHCGVM